MIIRHRFHKSVYYNILSNKADEISCIETDGENKTISYDFFKAVSNGKEDNLI